MMKNSDRTGISADFPAAFRDDRSVGYCPF